MRSRLWWAVALVVFAVGVSCSSSGNGEKAAPTDGRATWIDSDGHWVSPPQVAGGRFVAYLERDGRLSVAAVDPSSGERVWEMPASASGLTPGVALSLAHDEQNVYFGLPVDAGGTDRTVLVVAVDAASGTELWRTSQALDLTDNLSRCHDGDETVLCTTVVDARAGSSLRIAKATGAMTTSPLSDLTQARGGRQVGDKLYDLGGRDPERLAAVDDTGRTLWTKTASELFRGRPVSSDYGWAWHRYGDVLVGWLGRIDPDRSSTDLSERSVTAVGAATGAVLWVVDGFDLGCGLHTIDLDVDTSPLRCRRTGTVTRDQAGENPVVTGLNVTMEQFDPVTGMPAWEADLGAAESLVLGTPPVIRLSATEVVVGRQDGSSLAVDVASGKTRIPAPGETGWCSSENIYPDVRSYGQTKDRLGQDFVTPCRVDRSPVSGLAPDPPGAVATAGEVRAWVDAGGMRATVVG